MDTNDDEEDDFQGYQLSTTDDEENDENEYPVEASKPSPPTTAHIDTAVQSPIYAVPIVATKYQVFPSVQVPSSSFSISTSRKPSPIDAVTLVSTKSTVDIVTRRPINKEKSLSQSVTNTVLPNANVPASLSSS